VEPGVEREFDAGEEGVMAQPDVAWHRAETHEYLGIDSRI
jgi:hypothetical protein